MSDPEFTGIANTKKNRLLACRLKRKSLPYIIFEFEFTDMSVILQKKQKTLKFHNIFYKFLVCDQKILFSLTEIVVLILAKKYRR
jgi:hypothetical protein